MEILGQQNPVSPKRASLISCEAHHQAQLTFYSKADTTSESLNGDVRTNQVQFPPPRANIGQKQGSP